MELSDSGWFKSPNLNQLQLIKGLSYPGMLRRAATGYLHYRQEKRILLGGVSQAVS